jgi:hypothetical protein
MKNRDSLHSQKSIWSRLLCIRTTLQDVLYASYALPTGILQRLVPSGLRLATVNDDIAFVSLVILRSSQVRLSSFPVLRFDYNQFNIRTYIIDPASGQPAVYFIRSGVTSRVISLATSTIGITWEFIKLIIDLRVSKGVASSSISGDWEGQFFIKAQADTDISDVPLFFQDRMAAVNFLIRPLIGFAGDERRLVRFTIQHPEVQPESWSLMELDCPLFKKLVAIDDFKNPHSVFYLSTADFSISLPPTRIKKKE